MTTDTPQYERLKACEAALKFYAEQDCWEHDEQGVFFMAGAFSGPTMIEADRGELARAALKGVTCSICEKNQPLPDYVLCEDCAREVEKRVRAVRESGDA